MALALMKKLWPRSKRGNDVDDSNVDAVIARNLWKNHHIIPPNSKNKQNWDLVMMLLVFYNCVYIPIELFFLNGFVEHSDYPKSTVHTVVDYIVDLFFAIDILLNMTTAYYDEDYEMVLDRRQIICHYAKFWLWIDFFAFFPFDLLIFFVYWAAGVSDEQSVPTAIFSMFKVPRLLRLLR